MGAHPTVLEGDTGGYGLTREEIRRIFAAAGRTLSPAERLGLLLYITERKVTNPQIDEGATGGPVPAFAYRRKDIRSILRAAEEAAGHRLRRAERHALLRAVTDAAALYLFFSMFSNRSKKPASAGKGYSDGAPWEKLKRALQKGEIPLDSAQPPLSDLDPGAWLYIEFMKITARYLSADDVIDVLGTFRDSRYSQLDFAAIIGMLQNMSERSGSSGIQFDLKTRRRGQPKKPEIDALVDALTQIYEQVTERRAPKYISSPKVPFVTFVTACMTPLVSRFDQRQIPSIVRRVRRAPARARVT